MKYLLSKLKDITRPLRKFYPDWIKLIFLRNIINFIFFLPINVDKKRLSNFVIRLLISKRALMDIYNYPYKVRMEASDVFAASRKKAGFILSEEGKNQANIINDRGYSEPISIGLTTDNCNDVIKYFSSQRTVKGHSYTLDAEMEYSESLDQMKEKNVTPPLYLSYDIETQMRCKTLVDLILDPTILNITAAYFGCLPRLEFINTFWQLPADERPFLADFHRDFDDYKCLTVLIYWTETGEQNGATEYIPYTHRPNKKLSKILMSATDDVLCDKLSKFDSNEKIFNKFRTSTYPGYRQNRRYFELFKKEGDIVSLCGPPGSVLIANNDGLHRGPEKPTTRLVSWLRFGTSGGHPERSLQSMSKDFWTEEELLFFRANPLAEVLDDLLP